MSAHPSIPREIQDLFATPAPRRRASADPTRELAALWGLRALLGSDIPRHVERHHGLEAGLARAVGLGELVRAGSPRAVRARASKRLREIEQSRRYLEAPVLRSVRRAARRLGLDAIERLVLSVAVLCTVDDGLSSCFDDDALRVPALAAALGRSRREVRRALRRDGALRAGGLLSSHEFAVDEEIAEPLADGVCSVVAITRRAARRSRSSSLSLTDFDHLAREVALARDLLRGALSRRARGVHVLLHGAAGTGKTELARVLARELHARLYEVLDEDDDGDVASRLERLGKAALAHRVLGQTPRCLLLFDEAEDALALGHGGFEPGRDITRAKGWTHRMLEEAHVPMIWTANDVELVDPATLRRFAFVLELRVPPQRARRHILASRLEPMRVSAQWIDAAAGDERLSPAHVDQAARTVRLVGARSRARVEETLSLVIDRNLAVQGAPRVSRAAAPCGPYEPAFVNASVDTGSLAASLAGRPQGSVCLYGPPGTGKTAYAAHVAERLGVPLRAKRMSDLLGMWVGETERRVAAMFRAATAEGALLFLDEADGLLRDRSLAHNAWEVTQVNELLAQMEAFDGIFFCATNLIDQLDLASLRRFALKVEFRPLRAGQRRAMFERVFGALTPAAAASLAGADDLTPGDFAAVARQARLGTAAPDAERLVALLRAEVALRARRSGGRPIGFGAV